MAKKFNYNNSGEFVLPPPSFGLDITSFCIASHEAGHKLALELPFNLLFLFTAGIVEQRK